MYNGSSASYSTETGGEDERSTDWDDEACVLLRRDRHYDLNLLYRHVVYPLIRPDSKKI